MQPSAGYRQTRIAGLALTFVLAILTGCFPLVTPPPPQSPSAIPSFSLPSGYYEHDIQVTLSPPQAEAQLFFTLDGSLPDSATGTPYTQPLQFNADRPAVVVLRARALLPGDQWSPVATATYFVNISASLPLLSLVMDPDDLWDPQLGIYVNPLKKGLEWERPADLTYVDEERSTGFQVPAGIRIHGGGSREFDKKSFRLYFRQTYGIGRLDYPLFPSNPVQSFDRLVLHNGGQDYAVTPSPPFPPRINWTLLRNAVADSIVRELNGYAPYDQPVILFINGELWGLYYLRERIDDDRFLSEHFDADDVDFIEAPGHLHEEDVLRGDGKNWEQLVRFLDTHDLDDAAAYDYIQTQVDIENFIDYNLMQIYAANDDWPEGNVHQFRPRVQGGRWHWLLWDSDHSFGLQPRSHADLNMVEKVLIFNHPTTEGRDLVLLRALLKNTDFQAQFLSRAADLLNTTLAPEAVITHIDERAAEIAPDIDYETVRWAKSVNWEANIEELRDFARRRPVALRQHLSDAFNLGGTFSLTLAAPTAGQGSVAVNGMLTEALPWEGIYFQGLPLRVTAAPVPGYRFAGWSDPNLPNEPVLTLTLTTDSILAPRFEPLDIAVPHPNDIVFTDLEHREAHPWFELQVKRSGGGDLRGWRVTDNDTKTATDEGSLVFADLPAIANLPQGTIIRIIVDANPRVPDTIEPGARVVLYTGNGTLDGNIDPGFVISDEETLVLLAPGPSKAFDDDQGIAFWGKRDEVTPESFGVLSDGVW